MSHEIDFSNGRANMAFVGKTPWHNLGTELQPDADVDSWRQAAGLNFSINRAPIGMRVNDVYIDANGLERVVLYRSDTQVPLSIVSNRYQIVQPGEVLEFFRELVEAGGFRLHTAGSLFGGKKIWALAETGLKGTVSVPADKVGCYLLLATACDGSLATTAQFTTVRVVCNNTLTMSIRDGESTREHVRVPHSTKFDHAKVKSELGLVVQSWASFIEQAKELAKVKLSDTKALAVLHQVFEDVFEKKQDAQEFAKLPTTHRIIDLYNGGALGSELESANGTAWGFVNAITQYYDHEKRARIDDNRLASAWFGQGQAVKAAAFHRAMELVA
jgi:phage/plasmid-like protein (TIGR03299 family)